jgi:hypothetical protein
LTRRAKGGGQGLGIGTVTALAILRHVARRGGEGDQRSGVLAGDARKPARQGIPVADGTGLAALAEKRIVAAGVQNEDDRARIGAFKLAQNLVRRHGDERQVHRIGYLGIDRHEKILFRSLQPMTGIIDENHGLRLDLVAKLDEGALHAGLVDVAHELHFETDVAKCGIHGIRIGQRILERRKVLVGLIAENERKTFGDRLAKRRLW